jgi:LacI family transcriptional regulator
MARRLRIALLMESSRWYSQQMQRGIAAYAMAHGPWLFYHQMRALSDAAPAWLRGFQCDGILARIESRKLLGQIKRLALPTVDLYAMYSVKGIFPIDNDNQVIAQSAANHLLERGFTNFAFCGYSGVHFSEQRCAYFAGYLAGKGFEVAVYNGPPRPRTIDLSAMEVASLMRERELAKWIQSLSKPVGLLGCDDSRAFQVLNACGQYGVAVPDEVAVIGVDNDEVLCGLSNPPLSSIDPDAQKIGYEGAALLHRIIDGETVSSEKVLVPSCRVVVRQSTNVLAMADSRVAAAMHFIRQHACDGIVVEDVLRELRLSRSTLERRFAEMLGRSPKAEINRVQLERVKDLLRTTDFPLAKIARLAGFSYVESMYYAFKKATGQTPGQYRKQPKMP